jgi:hypothetical protein
MAKTIGIVCVAIGGKHRPGVIWYGDHSDPTPNQIGDHFRNPIIVSFQPTVFDRHVLPLDKAGFGEASAEVGENFDRVLGRPRAQISDHRHRLLLRSRRQRPRRCRTSEQAYELAPLNVMHWRSPARVE